MNLFEDELVKEFMEWKNANSNTFTWWNFVNMKADLQTALGFAKFFYPEIIEIDGCFILKDKYDKRIFDAWKAECNDDKTCIEKMMNLYEVADFFHMNTTFDKEEDEEEQIKALGNVLKLFWSMSFKERFPDRKIFVDVFEEYDDQLFITVYEECKK
jgi:hypothetical protein